MMFRHAAALAFVAIVLSAVHSNAAQVCCALSNLCPMQNSTSAADDSLITANLPDRLS
jgi:hypothetical protein